MPPVPPQIPAHPKALDEPCALVKPTVQADGTMTAYDMLAFINASDLAIVYCDKKRQLAIDSWPSTPVETSAVSTKKKR